MTQVLVNLLENAVKYFPSDSEIKIYVRLDKTPLQIEVEDRGHGVPEGDLEAIFDKFYQVPILEGRDGTGLGLSICKGIMEAHGGKIRAQNHAGRGFTVIVKLTSNAASRDDVDPGEQN